MSVAIGASAAGARAYTATASQGLLFMAEALYNASGLGLPIVMTVANRAIGAPINIWNDHSDAMSQRDSGWIQLYAETNQEAADLHIQAFRIAEELSLPVMVCMDGFVLTHAVERVDAPEPGPGRRVPAAVRAAPGPRPGRPGLDRRDGRPRGVHRGPLPGPRSAAAGARRDPGTVGRVRQRCSAGDSGGLVRPYRDRRRGARRGRARLGAGYAQGRRRRTAGRRRADRRAGHHVLPAVPARPRSGGAGDAQRHVVVLERAFAVGAGGIVTADVRMPPWPPGTALYHGGRRPRRPPGHRRRCARCSTEAGDLAAAHFLDLDPEPGRGRAGPDERRRRSGPSAENILRDLGITASGSDRPHAVPADQVLPDRQLRGRQPAAHPGPAQRPGDAGGPTR